MQRDRALHIWHTTLLLEGMGDQMGNASALSWSTRNPLEWGGCRLSWFKDGLGILGFCVFQRNECQRDHCSSK